MEERSGSTSSLADGTSKSPSSLQSKRPPNIWIASSHIAEMKAQSSAGPTPTTTGPAPVVAAASERTMMLSTSSSTAAAGESTALGGASAAGTSVLRAVDGNASSMMPEDRKPNNNNSGQLCSDAQSTGSDSFTTVSGATAASDSQPPAVILHSATKTMSFVDFDVTTTHQQQHSSTDRHHPINSQTQQEHNNNNNNHAANSYHSPGTSSSQQQQGLIKRNHNNNSNNNTNSDANISDAGGHHSTVVVVVPPTPSVLQQRNNNNNPLTGAAAAAPANPHPPSSTTNGKNIPHNVLIRNLTLFVVLKVLGSFDSGAFSATLNGDNGITEDWGLSVAQQGTLSSSVFLGNMIGCAMAGHLFSIYSAKLLLTVALIIHGVFTFLFASAETYDFALLCRFFIGVTLGFIVVYTPVWVDEFAPRSSAALWMALQNAGVPIGVMLGFVIGGLMPTYTSVSWEWSFYFKSIVMVPVVALVIKTDRRTLDSSGLASAAAEYEKHVERQREAAAAKRAAAHAAAAAANGGGAVLNNSSLNAQPSSPLRDTFVATFKRSYLRMKYIGSRLVRNGVWISNMLSLSSLYFVVSGLQTFITSYLRAEPFNASMQTIVIGFGCAVVTAPVFGVICGGILLDRIGGYHGNLVRASRFGLAWGTAAAVFAIVCIFIRTTTVFLFVVWILLFCGGAIIPPGSGINMASLPATLRPSGSSVAQMSFNFLGNFSGPLLCGWIAEWTGSLTWGVRTVFGMGVVGVIPMVVCTLLASRRARRQALLEQANARSQFEHEHLMANQRDNNNGGGSCSCHEIRDEDRTHSDHNGHLHHVNCHVAMSILGAMTPDYDDMESARNSEEEFELMDYDVDDVVVTQHYVVGVLTTNDTASKSKNSGNNNSRSTSVEAIGGGAIAGDGGGGGGGAGNGSATSMDGVAVGVAPHQPTQLQPHQLLQPPQTATTQLQHHHLPSPLLYYPSNQQGNHNNINNGRHSYDGSTTDPLSVVMGPASPGGRSSTTTTPARKDSMRRASPGARGGVTTPTTTTTSQQRGHHRNGSSTANSVVSSPQLAAQHQSNRLRQPPPLSRTPSGGPVVGFSSSVPDGVGNRSSGDRLGDSQRSLGGGAYPLDSTLDDDDWGGDASVANDLSNFSFPYQHSFGMDVVRGLLNIDVSPSTNQQHQQQLQQSDGGAPTPTLLQQRSSSVSAGRRSTSTSPALQQSQNEFAT